MLMPMLKPEIPDNTPKNAKKQQITERQKNTKTEIWAKWGSDFYIQLARGDNLPLCPPSVTPLALRNTLKTLWTCSLC